MTCIFCQPQDPGLNRILDENDGFYARYDNFPVSPGHIEIVPRRHVASFFDLLPRETGEAFRLLARVQRLLQAQYQPDGYNIGVNDGEAAGRTISHLHIHLIPRYHGDVPDPRGGVRNIFPGGNPGQWSS